MPPRPWFVFEITPDCNADCIYCYNVWKAPGAGRPVPLDTRAAAGLIRKLRAEAEPAGITFTGGEPLLRDDLVELVSAASTAGIPRICIATNGVLLTPELAGRLTGAGARHFEVSLPSSDRAIYESLCGLDALTAAREAIRHAVSAGTEVSVAVMLGGPTLSCVADVVSTAFAYGARAVVLNRFSPGAVVSGERRARLLPSTAELVSALESAAGRAAGLGIPVGAGIPLEPCIFGSDLPEGLDTGACVCARAKWAIDPEGRLRCCEQSPGILGSLLTSSFGQLSDAEAVRTFLDSGLSPECGSCRHHPDCGGGCRFSALAGGPPSPGWSRTPEPARRSRRRD